MLNVSTELWNQQTSPTTLHSGCWYLEHVHYNFGLKMGHAWQYQGGLH